MFVDLSGFTALSETMDPEAVRDLVNACFESLVPIINKYGGTIDKFIGDEIMALFGAPLSYENDPERALRAALEMQTALENFNLEHNTTLGMHFGINTGLVIAGAIGTPSQQSYSVIGNAVNLAARLKDASKRGQIFVGPNTYRLTAQTFHFDALPPIQLKGKKEAVSIYQLHELKASFKSGRGLPDLSSPLVGRKKFR